MSYFNCLKNGYHFIDNSNISNTVRMVHLYKDGLHLNNYGKDESANNFIDALDFFYKQLRILSRTRVA